MNTGLDGLMKLREKPANEGDYIRDGLLYCGSCNTPKQCRHTLLESDRILPCLCTCAGKASVEKAARERETQVMLYISRLKTAGIQDRQIQGWTFENDDNSKPAVSRKARRYCESWDTIYRDNIGLLFWGDVGTGKTFFAACIANALLERGVPVLMTSFGKIVNALSGFGNSDKNEYLSSLNRYRLLVIDDLGAERRSEFTTEIVYNVIDTRYKNGQPLIVTTNIFLDAIKTEGSIEHRRIYDRIMEMCVPVECKGESRRRGVYRDKIAKAKALLE